MTRNPSTCSPRPHPLPPPSPCRSFLPSFHLVRRPPRSLGSMTPATLVDRMPSEGDAPQHRPLRHDSRASGAVKISRPEERVPELGQEHGDVRTATVAEEAAESGRERLKRHRTEMGGRVWIPEIWGQESLLKDWTDGSVFDRPLVPKGLTSAREALVQDCRRTNSAACRIRNPC
ncbi:uncharacterized protein LOC141822481 [Curcuma longa]|uniref:uncharacterized protein LOC141822481 n=1 Tax=Curcuma longa TaxID=136217 RepID=UPI003D9F61D2